jgi:hypothetical protein
MEVDDEKEEQKVDDDNEERNVCVCVLVLRFQGAVFQLRDTNR